MSGSEISLSKPIKWNVGKTNTFTSDEIQFIEGKYSGKPGAFKDITITLPIKIGQSDTQEMTFLVTRELNGEIHFAITDFFSKTNIYSKQIEQAINKSRGAQPSITSTSESTEITPELTRKIPDGFLNEKSKKFKSEKTKLDLLSKQTTEQPAETKIELGAKVRRKASTSERIDDPFGGSILDGVEVIDISSTEALNKAIAAHNEEKGVLAFIKDETGVEAEIEKPEIILKSILKQKTETTTATEKDVAQECEDATPKNKSKLLDVTAEPVELLLNKVSQQAKTGVDEKPVLNISGIKESQRTLKAGSDKFKLKAIDSLVKLDQELDVVFECPLIVVHLENLLVCEELTDPFWGNKEVVQTSLGIKAALMFERIRRKAVTYKQARILILSRKPVEESEALLKKHGLIKNGNGNGKNKHTSYDEIVQIKGDNASVQGIVQAIRDQERVLGMKLKRVIGEDHAVDEGFTCIKVIDENPEQLAMTIFELSQDHQLKPSLDETQTKEAIPVQGIAVIGSAQSQIDVGMHKTPRSTADGWARETKQTYLLNNRSWVQNNQFGDLDVEINIT